ncbi:MAG: GTP-binding protein [Acidimicrobiales bacterium]|nr:GTP-binding protein [Acidimicrobiales bacterium]MCB9393123.1 GTP-binding protein [Acidimicrobiaceae bacterium]
MSSAPIPVTVIGGYLGAGKTTLVNRLLAGATGERIAVLVNDFGSVSIDASLIASSDGDTIRLANGCVCCSLAGGFVEAMTRVAEFDPRPDRLVVEASGVADPAAVAQYAHLPGFGLDAVVVLADAETVRRRADDALVGAHVRRQLAGADLVVLNKADLVDPATLERVCDWARTQADGVPIVAAVEAVVPLALLLGTAPRSATREAPRAEAHVDHATVTITGRTAVMRRALDDALAALPDGVVRVKGFVELTDPDGTRVLVQRVGARMRIVPFDRDPDSPPVQLVVIGLSGPAVAAAGRTLADALGATLAEPGIERHHQEHP